MERPYISLNFAISADGRITSVAGIRSGWTSAADQARFAALREPADALMVGRGTLEADRMTLRAPRNPLRCVVSAAGRFDPMHPLFHTAGGPIHLLGTAAAPMEIPGTTGHHESLDGFLRTLRGLGVRYLHCEGGGRLVRALAELDAIDEIHLTWAGHRLFGGAGAPGISGPAGDFLPASLTFELVHFEPVPDCGECFLSYRRKRGSSPGSGR